MFESRIIHRFAFLSTVLHGSNRALRDSSAPQDIACFEVCVSRGC